MSIFQGGEVVRILVIGSGGREHALVWKLKQSPRVSEVFVAPGNGGTAREGAINVAVDAGDLDGLVELARKEKIDLVVPGPELPLTKGITDRMREAGIPCFGPDAYCARLEGSKAFAKDVMNRAGVPTAHSQVFTDPDKAKNAVVKLGAPLVVKADVGDTAACEKMLEDVVAAMGKIDILVNNAGITRDTLLMRMKEADWDAVLTTNLKSVYNCTKAAIKYMMKARSGRIVNISSVVGAMGNAGQANYAAAKAGILGFTKAVAKETASRGITVNAVAPGFIATDMTAVLSDKVVDNLKAGIPMGRLGAPEDIAKAVAFLVSDDAAYITGQTLHVNGGMYMD